MRALALFALVALAACDPQDFADKVGRRTAETVVMPVVASYLPSGQAQSATLCIVENASAAEVQALARDVGTRAGTLTVQNVRTIAARPETIACMARAGVPPLPL